MTDNGGYHGLHGPAKDHWNKEKDDRHSKTGFTGLAKKEGLNGWGSFKDLEQQGLEEVYGGKQRENLDKNDPLYQDPKDDVKNANSRIAAI